MSGIQWIKRGGRHRDVRGREKERVGREQVEEALTPAPKPARGAKGSTKPSRTAKRRTATAGGRFVEVPRDLARALRGAPAARAFFDGLSYTHRKDYATWVSGARRPETRARRVEDAIRLLTARKRWKDR